MIIMIFVLVYPLFNAVWFKFFNIRGKQFGFCRMRIHTRAAFVFLSCYTHLYTVSHLSYIRHQKALSPKISMTCLWFPVNMHAPLLRDIPIGLKQIPVRVRGFTRLRNSCHFNEKTTHVVILGYVDIFIQNIWTCSPFY